MNDETPAILTDPLAEPMASNLALGAALRAAREHLGMEVEQVAQQLRMSVHQIKALEEDNLTVLTSPAFVRGFIRNYARLLNISPEPLVAAYKVMQPEAASGVAIHLQSENIAIVNASRRTMLMYLSASVLVVVVGVAWWFYQDWREMKPATSATETRSVVKAQETQPPSQPAAIHEPTVYIPASEAAVPEATPPAVPASVSETVATQGDIRMKFSEQTWVSITDSTGKEVFNKNKAAETEDFASGVPPYDVAIGNAVGVQVFYKGKPFDIYPHTKANVARFTLE